MDNNNNNNQAEILSKSIPDHVIPFIDEHLHRLILTDEVRDYHAIFCKSCNFPIRSGLSYACLPCKFAVHKICPNKTLPKLSIRLPKSEIFDETELKFSDLKSQTLACHGSYQVCLVCGDLCTGTLKYECSKSFGCHESCSLLPAEIQHPLHNHKLILGFPKIGIRNPSLFPCESCCICKSKLQQFNSSRISQVYQCTTCLDFYMHIECAQQMPMIRHSAHEHLLIFLRIKKEVSNRYRDVECNWCRRGWTEEKIDFGVYRCVFCEFSIHESCLKYPKVLENNEEHHHPLQYIVLPAINHHGGEYEWSKDDYCETCADDIIKTEPIFMCLKCPNEFLFHRDCAIASSQESTEQGYHSMIQFQDLGDHYALFPGWLLPDERKSELMGKIESLTLDLEEDIRILTVLQSQSN